ncbi:MAG: aldo/keto reductase [Flavobacteriaceae bacterium]
MNCIENIGLGTAAIGRPLYINIKQGAPTELFSLSKFKESGVETLENAYQKGIRCFDTSPGYGVAEELLTHWLKDKNDPTIKVSTKWGYTYVANFKPNAKEHEVKEHSLEKLNEQWEVSKQLLPYLKVYQIHSATFDTGVLDNQPILERLYQIKKENGIIIGLSTTGDNQVEVLKKAMEITIEGEKLFQSVQCTFNILEQSISEVKGELNNFEGSLFIKEALANGRLIPNEKYFQYKNLYDFMKQLAEKHQVGEDAIALRYIMEIFPKAIVLSGANNSEHLTSNLEANNINLSASEIKQLNVFGIQNTEYWNQRKQLQWN